MTVAMDQWLQKLSMVIVLITGAFAIHAMRSGADCWCPAQFTTSHVRYTNAFCSSNHSQRYQLPTQAIPRGEQDLLTYNPQPYTNLFSEDNTLLKVIAGELLLICALYSLIKCLIATSNFDTIYPGNLHKSYSKVPVYITIQIAGCLMWIFFAVLTYRTYNEDTMHKSCEPFLCNFVIRHTNRVHDYVVQCVDSGVLGLKSTISMNVGLCVVVAFSKLVHLVAIFGIQPLLKVNKVANKMVERRIIMSKEEVGLRFGMSDLYFAILVTGRDVSQQLRPKLEERREIPLYNSRPPSMVC